MSRRSYVIVLLLSLKAASVVYCLSSTATNARNRPMVARVAEQRGTCTKETGTSTSEEAASSPAPSVEGATFPSAAMTLSRSDDEPSTFSKLSRRIRVFALAGHIFLSYKMVQFKENKLRRRLGLSQDSEVDDDHPAILELWDKAHQKNSKRILRAIEQLQGFWIKVGQYLSSRADVMPRQYLEILASLQDGVPEKPFEDVEKTLQEQLTPEALDLFEEINHFPLSTASLAQVHRATLRDGREVVIKAQHRGVASLMTQDMENLRTILQMLSKFEPDMDYNPVVDEYTKEVRKELDFRTEADNMKQVKDLLDARKVRAIVPTVIPQLVTEKVLVMEYCEGFPIRDIASLEKYQVDRELLLDRVCTSWALQMHVGGLFNADPHPGNILVSTSQEDGDSSVPVLLDFGLTKCFTPEMKVAFSRLVHSSFETDVDGLLQSFDEMGLKLNRYDPFQDMQVMQASFSDPAPQSEAAEAKKQRAKDWKEKQEAMRKEQGVKKGQKLRNPVDAWPSELIFFTRVSAMLRGLCSRLEVRYPYLACMAAAASETLRQSVPSEEHAEHPVFESSDQIYSSKLQQQTQDLALELIEEDHAVGMQVCVIHQGATVVNVAAGSLGTANPRPVTPSSLFNVFSVSKAVLASGVLHLLQEKSISVDDPISKYWPEFGASRADKRLITIRHALCHQAGLANAFPSDASIETLTNWEEMKAFIAGSDAVPSHKPGEETHYHYLTFAWLLGGLVEAITGQPYDYYLTEHLIGPLSLENEVHLGGLPDEVAREELAVLTARTLRDSGGTQDLNKVGDNRKLAKFQGKEQMLNPSVFNMRKVRASKIPSANGHASAYGLAMLMNAVTSKDNAILSSAILEQAGSPQQCSGTSSRGSNVMLDNSLAAFGLGFQIHELKQRSNGSTVRSLGHSGFGGSVVVSIPQMELTIAFTTNQLKMKSVARNRVLSTLLHEYGLEPPKSLLD